MWTCWRLKELARGMPEDDLSEGASPLRMLRIRMSGD